MSARFTHRRLALAMCRKRAGDYRRVTDGHGALARHRNVEKSEKERRKSWQIGIPAARQPRRERSFAPANHTRAPRKRAAERRTDNRRSRCNAPLLSSSPPVALGFATLLSRVKRSGVEQKTGRSSPPEEVARQNSKLRKR